MNFVPFEAHHAKFCKMKTVALEGIGMLTVHHLANFYKQGGPAWTGFHKKEWVCSAGIFVWPSSGKPGMRTGEAWAFVNREAAKGCPLALTKVVRDKITEIAGAEGLGRVQANVYAGDKSALRWAAVLGFECEGLMPRYLGGMDHFRFGRVF